MKNHIEYLDYVEGIAKDILDETTDRERAEELVWEYADSSQHVVYYSRAHDLVHLVRNWDSSLYNDAQDEVEDLIGGEFLDYDTYATKLAFSILRIHLSQLVNDQIENCVEVVA